MASVYQPLGAYLARQPGPTVTLPFREVEAILARPLPPGARANRGWWDNYHARTQAYHGWLAVGWRSEGVDLARQVVTFRQS